MSYYTIGSPQKQSDKQQKPMLQSLYKPLHSFVFVDTHLILSQ